MKIIIAMILVVLTIPGSLLAETARTRNFIVTADSHASDYANKLESYREQHARTFFARPLPSWSKPCIVSVSRFPGPDKGRGGGATIFDVLPPGYNKAIEESGSKATGFVMNLSMDHSAADDVLKHECLHAVLYSHLGHLDSRWADEGICSAVEQSHALDRTLQVALSKRRFYSVQSLFSMKEYPTDEQDMLLFYSQAQSQVRFLLQSAGPRYFVYFIQVGQDKGYPYALQHCYSYKFNQLQVAWLSWVKASSPANPYISDYVDESGSRGAKNLDPNTHDPDTLAPVIQPKPYKVGYG